MRLSFFILLTSLLTPMSLLAADCRTSSGDIPSGGSYGPCDNLYIDSPLTLGTHLDPVIIDVTGDVFITHNVTLDGSDGVLSVSGSSAMGGDGGPGASYGGDVDSFNGPQDGGAGRDPDGDFTVDVTTAADGKTTADDLTCGNGGGGAGLWIAGSNGSVCSTSNDPLTVGQGGAVAYPALFDFTLGAFRGGFGGGAGAYGGAGQLSGTGGGGGGGLYIKAGGNINISSGVTLSARGGKGGEPGGDGGGGGGGSGGAIWLEAAGVITNQGTIDVRGGAGGEDPLLPNAGEGGNGGNGVYRLQDINGTLTDHGLLIGSSGSGSAIQSTQKLSSSISCGTISAKKDNSSLFQIALGFILALGIVASGRKISAYKFFTY
jgi:hypothetical protein